MRARESCARILLKQHARMHTRVVCIHTNDGSIGSRVFTQNKHNITRVRAYDSNKRQYTDDDRVAKLVETQ